jgi:hypothetical protein
LINSGLKFKPAAHAARQNHQAFGAEARRSSHGRQIPSLRVYVYGKIISLSSARTIPGNVHSLPQKNAATSTSAIDYAVISLNFNHSREDR